MDSVSEHGDLIGEGPWVSPREVASRLRVTTQSVYSWVREGRLPATKLNNRLLRIRWDDAAKLLSPPPT